MNSKQEKSLVIIDDEVAYLNYLGEVMSMHLSCPVLTFSRPLAALEAMRSVDVGVVATDYYMPQMTGFELVACTRPFLADIPFILITGHGAGLSARELERFPEIKTVLDKPFTWRILADAVARHWPDQPGPGIREL